MGLLHCIVLLVSCFAYYYAYSLVNIRSTSRLSISCTLCSGYNSDNKILISNANNNNYNAYDDQSFPRFGRKIDARTLSREQFIALYDGKLPVVFTNVFDMSHYKSNSMSREEACRRLMDALSDKVIQYDARDNQDATVDSYECTLGEFLATLPDSSDHEDSVYFMSEAILQDKALAWFDEVMRLPATLFDANYFDSFPVSIRPKNALIIGGVGARSFLHVDPYRWIGWNYLLEGRKLWTFLPPAVDKKLLLAYPNSPDAWDQLNLTCGYVSEVDLYRYQTQSSQYHGKPINILAGAWTTHVQQHSDTISAQQHASIPNFQPDNFVFNDVDHARLAALVKAGAMQIIQEEGEMVVFPAGYWHQVYHLEPSIAIASQYCNEVIMKDVFTHVLRYCSKDGDNDDLSVKTIVDACSKASVSDAVRMMLEEALIRRFGDDDGRMKFRRLYEHEKEDEKVTSRKTS